MTGRHLPPHDHVFGHFKNPDFVWDVENPDQALALRPDAFRVDEDGISTTWLEFFIGSYEQRLVDVRRAMNRDLRPKHRLAGFRVSDICSLSDDERTLTVVHDPVTDPPDKANLAHALIQGCQKGDSDALNRLAKVCSAIEMAVL